MKTQLGTQTKSGKGLRAFGEDRWRGRWPQLALRRERIWKGMWVRLPEGGAPSARNTFLLKT